MKSAKVTQRRRTKDGKASKQETQMQAHHKIAESATQTHTQKQTKDYVHGI
jgi:hypothetical protein